MPKDSNPKSSSSKKEKGKSFHSKRTTSHLKLVVSSSAPIEKTSSSQPQLLNTSFTVKIQQRGDDLYEMNIQDSFHDLACELILEIEKKEGETAVVCHFPAILDEANKFLDEDEELYGTIMIQFQMKVLDHLFLFCMEREASHISIYADNEEAEGFWILQGFLAHYDESVTENGEQTEIVISTGRTILDQWRKFMGKTNLELEQDLWRQQRHNPSIRSYLQSRTCS